MLGGAQAAKCMEVMDSEKLAETMNCLHPMVCGRIMQEFASAKAGEVINQLSTNAGTCTQ